MPSHPEFEPSWKVWHDAVELANVVRFSVQRAHILSCFIHKAIRYPSGRASLDAHFAPEVAEILVHFAAKNLQGFPSPVLPKGTDAVSPLVHPTSPLLPFD